MHAPVPDKPFADSGVFCSKDRDVRQKYISGKVPLPVDINFESSVVDFLLPAPLRLFMEQDATAVGEYVVIKKSTHDLNYIYFEIGSIHVKVKMKGVKMMNLTC